MIRRPAGSTRWSTLRRALRATRRAALRSTLRFSLRPTLRAVILVAALLTACSTGRSRLSAPGPDSPAYADAMPVDTTDVAVVYGPRPTLPGQAGGWQLVRSTFDDPDVGTVGRYESGDGLHADAYVYPIRGPDALCSRECAASWVHGEADQFIARMVPQLLGQGYWSEMELVSDSLVHLDRAGTTEGRHLAFRVEEDGDVGRSDFLLVAFNGYRIKVRSSRLDPDADGGRALAFFRSVVGDLVPAYRCLHGSADPEQERVQMVNTTRTPAEEAVRTIGQVLDANGMVLKSRVNPWTTAPDFEPPADAASELAGGYPGFQLMLFIQGDSDSTRYTASAPPVCALQSRTDEMLSTAVQALFLNRIVPKLDEALDQNR